LAVYAAWVEESLCPFFRFCVFLFALTSALLLVIVAHLVGLWHAGGVGQPRASNNATGSFSPA